MILVAVLDGLRPDMVTSETMPFLSRAAEQGVRARASHAVYPTVTRVNAASLITGCYPRQHGLVGNSLYAPEVDPDRSLSCADWRALQAVAQSEHGRLLTVPTLGEILGSAGHSMVSAGSGSPGTTFLTNPTVTAPVLNWATAWPAETRRWVQAETAGFLDSSASGLERTDFVLRGLCEELVPSRSPDVIVVWITEPDHTQHDFGLGSPEAIAVLRKVDDRLDSLVAYLGDRADGSLDCFCISDHGFSTLSDHLSLTEMASHLGGDGVVLTHSGLYVKPDVAPNLGEIVGTMSADSRLGTLFVKDGLTGEAPGSLPQSAVFGGHTRSPAVLHSGRWTDEPNAHGVRGLAVGASTHVASHGSASPYDIRNTMIAWGPHIRRSHVTDVPCGIVDVTPTILHLLGVSIPAHLDGRPLADWLRGQDAGLPGPVGTRVCRDALPGQAGSRLVHYATVGPYTYLDQVTPSPHSLE